MGENLEGYGALAAIIGGGGISGILIAVFGYLKAARDGRPGEPEKAGLGISALLADSTSITKLSLALETICLHLSKIGLITETSQAEFFDKFENFIDEVRKLRRAVEDLKK